MKRTLSIFITLLFPLGAFAQEQKSFWDDPINSPMLPLYLVTTFVFIVIILVGAVALYLIKVLNMLTEQAEKERAQKLGVVYVPRPNWWSRFSQKMNASVPVEQEKDIELHHSYDGIKELDNHLPPWWKWLFYGTIGWSVVYLVVYHFSATLPLQLQEYENEVAVAEEQARIFKASQPQEAIDENQLVFAKDAAIIEKGKSVFMNNNCASCHRNDGGGNTIGPNLTDEYWLHGGDVKQVFLTVKNGVVEKGMPAWGKVLSPQDVRDVTFFILSLQGSNPANAKAPQGELFKQKAIASDTTNAQASL
ncbi:cbb3-type cytochrome c oxidase N-terminal domain-containing protein [Chryseosolibacter indicus]|uniref:C-type cytochrome n=1 Tax=Chryseosolibacter indicus TaxID=2782351 RepID=A0ABS5VQM4_9BACT|nr:cbb3-type cytochrome c oxidase N-terminal domain-containing protein [Chryseosolibacter indicus]MBT1703749.1 c-type cytochrome [Chryseosolibacter indicus]